MAHVRPHHSKRSGIFSGPALSGSDSAPQHSSQNKSQPEPSKAPKASRTRRTPIGKLLLEMGALSQADLLRATALRQRQDTRIGDILLAHGMVEESTLYKALARQYGAEIANFERYRADVRLIDALGADECLRRGILPWRRVGSTVLIASCRPEQFEEIRPFLTSIYGQVRLAVISETGLHEALLKSRQRKLALAAETRVAAHESCRELDIARLTRVFSVIGFLLIAATIIAPRQMFLGLVIWAIVLLVVTSGFKLAAAFAQARRSKKTQATFATQRSRKKLPIVSVMVPLFHEREIAGRLIKRLSRLTYPRELLDICLVVEEDDTITQEAVANTELPRWMRMIVVPRGGVKTKPRALNFALDFCRGSIIGIYDAEDAPEPDQIHKVAHHFNNAAPDVACLQGVLDFYNSRTNWLARCFTVEYASWFRVILPGYEKLGLVVPLGGTTLFFRRDAIEKLGGWDAHNVTEDADLGIRLARHGYRTELIRTVTDEEANCRMWPWVKQRSRWLKGYAMTWAMHMRSPKVLLQDLGLWKFIGVQVLFFGSLSNAVLAPLLWSFWLLPLGFHHPLQDIVPNGTFIFLGALFLLSEVVTVAIGMVATSTPKHKGMWRWVPTLHFYYPLGTLAAIKGLWEVMTNPFYWDKTAHGVHDIIELEDEPEAALTPAQPEHIHASPSQQRPAQSPSQSAAPFQLAPEARLDQPRADGPAVDGSASGLPTLVLGQAQAVQSQTASSGASSALRDPAQAWGAPAPRHTLRPAPHQGGYQPLQSSAPRTPELSGFAEAAQAFEHAGSARGASSHTPPHTPTLDELALDTALPPAPERRLTFGLHLPKDAQAVLPEWLQEDLEINGPLRGAPIDAARLRPTPRPSAEESLARARQTGEAPFLDLSNMDDDYAPGSASLPESGSEAGPISIPVSVPVPTRVSLPVPAPANLHLPPQMSHTAAFADVPDWLPLSKHSPHRRVKSQQSSQHTGTDRPAPLRLSRHELKG